jgi:phage tail-like protein
VELTTLSGRASSWLEHLPAVFREEEGGEPGFLGRFLLAFEHVLTGVGDPDDPGLDERLDRVPEYFSPELAPSDFLDWLAGWVGLTLRADLDAGEGAGGRREQARGLIADAVPLYRLRGTRRGLEELIRRLAGGLSPTITELSVPMQVGVASRIGVDTRVDGGPPHFFHVLLRLPHPDPAQRQRAEALVRAVLDVEKPAHTRYQLDVATPAMRIGTQSTIGVDTLLSPSLNPGTL